MECICLGLRRNENADVTVIEDVLDLGRLEHGIDGYEYSARKARRKICDDALDALVQIDGDPIVGTESE